MGLLDDIRKNLMGGYDLPEMRLVIFTKFWCDIHNILVHGLAELYEPHYRVYEDHCPENGPALSITIISRSAVILFILPH